MKFIIQERNNLYDIWYTPQPSKVVMESNSIDELRKSLRYIADTTTFDWWQHYRIITIDGNPVNRYKIKPGIMKRTRVRY